MFLICRRDKKCGLKVAVAEDGDVVREVSGDHEGEGADGEGIVAGNAAARPSVCGEIAKKRN